MAEIQTFRSALNGFNRQDVVNYIEYMNNRHNAQLQQLNNQLQSAKADPQLQDRLDAAEARIRELEAQLEAATQAAPVEAAPAQAPAVMNATQEELAAYRRAERTERLAGERAQQLQDKANGILADVRIQAEDYVKAVRQAQESLLASLTRYQDVILDVNPDLDQAIAALSQLKID